MWGLYSSPPSSSHPSSTRHNGAASLLQGAQAGGSCDKPRRPISILIPFKAKKEIIWFTYNVVPPPLCWKPLMMQCLPSAGLRVFCQTAMMDYALGGLLWLSARHRKRNERVAKRQGNTSICHACHLRAGGRFRKKKLKETLSSRFPAPHLPPHQWPSLQERHEPTLEMGGVLVAVDYILHFESLTEGVTTL